MRYQIFQGEEPISPTRKKKPISYSEKHPFKLASFHLVVLTKTRIGSKNVARNKAFLLAKLMLNCIVIVENTTTQFTYKVITILCLSVLNDDNTVVHKICTYKYMYFHPWCTLWIYSNVHQIKENNNKNNCLNRPFSQKSIIFFTVFYGAGSPPCIRKHEWTDFFMSFWSENQSSSSKPGLGPKN